MSSSQVLQEIDEDGEEEVSDERAAKRLNGHAGATAAAAAAAAASTNGSNQPLPRPVVLTNKLRSLVDEYKMIATSPRHFKLTYFRLLRDNIENKRTRLKQKIDRVADELLAKLDVIRDECMADGVSSSSAANSSSLLNTSNASTATNTTTASTMTASTTTTTTTTTTNGDESYDVHDELLEMRMKMWTSQSLTTASAASEAEMNDMCAKIETQIRLAQRNLVELRIDLLQGNEFSFNKSDAALVDPSANDSGTRSNSGGELIDESLFGRFIHRPWPIDKYSACSRTLVGHTSYVNCLMLSEDKTRLFSAGSDFLIKVWELASGKCVHTLKEHTGPIYCLKMLPMGTHLISGSFDTTIKVWDLKSMRCVNTLKGHTFDVNCMELLSNGQLLSASSDKTIKLWNMFGQKCVKTFKGHAQGVLCLTLVVRDAAQQQQPPSVRIVSGSFDNTIKLWELTGTECVATLQGHTAPVRSVKLAPDARSLFSCSQDKTIRQWNLSTLAPMLTIEEDWPVLCMEWFPVGTNHRLLMCGLAGKQANIRLWDVKRQRLVKQVRGHAGAVRCLLLLPDEQVVSCSEDKTIKYWQI